jgi:membrane protein YdbS with pleckstrin-like domain
VAFPRKLLAPGEEIVLEAHPNWSILVPRVLLFLVVVAGCVAVVVEWTSAPLWVGWALLGIAGVSLLALLAKIAVWRSTTLVLTNLRVVYRTGALRRLGREIPLDRVQDVTYSQSILERMVGAGSLTIESAGAHGDDPFPDIRHPAAVQSLINRLITQPGGGLGGSSARAGYVQPQAYQPAPQQPYEAPPPQTYDPPRQAYEAPTQQYQPAQQPYPPPQQAYQAYPPQAQQPQYAPRPDVVPVPESSGTTGRLTDSSSEQLQRLSELHRLGVITDAEYAQKRQELIDGS